MLTVGLDGRGGGGPHNTFIYLFIYLLSIYLGFITQDLYRAHNPYLRTFQ